MAVRTPIYIDSGNLKEMSSTMVDDLILQMIYQYMLTPGVSLTYVASGGNLGTISDTRLQAGGYSVGTASFPGEGTTAEPTQVTVSHSKINQNVGTTAFPTDNGKTFPLYKTSTHHLQSMTQQDMLDTFVHPAVDLMVNGSISDTTGGTYTILTSSTGLSNTQIVSASPVYTDTRANTSAYTASGIPETLDQPTTITSYYLHKSYTNDNTYTMPMYTTSAGHIAEYDETIFETMMRDCLMNTTQSSTNGYKIRYSINGTGTNRGTGMVDTRLNGSGNYQQRYVGLDDYRAQEFPNGSPVTIATSYLKIRKE